MDSLPLELLEEIGDYLDTPHTFEAFCDAFAMVDQDTYYKRRWKINNYDLVDTLNEDDVDIFREVCRIRNMTLSSLFITEHMINKFKGAVTSHMKNEDITILVEDIIIFFIYCCIAKNSINILTWILNENNSYLNNNIVSLLTVTCKDENPKQFIDLIFTCCEDGIRANIDKCLYAVIKGDDSYAFEKCIELEYSNNNNRMTKQDFYINLMSPVLFKHALKCFTFLMEQPEYNYMVFNGMCGRVVIIDVAQLQCEPLFHNYVFRKKIEFLEIALKYIDPTPTDVYHMLCWLPSRSLSNEMMDKMASLLILHPGFTYKKAWSDRFNIIMYYLSHIILKIRSVMPFMAFSTIYLYLSTICFYIFFLVFINIGIIRRTIPFISTVIISIITFAYLCGVKDLSWYCSADRVKEYGHILMYGLCQRIMTALYKLLKKVISI